MKNKRIYILSAVIVLLLAISLLVRYCIIPTGKLFSGTFLSGLNREELTKQVNADYLALFNPDSRKRFKLWDINKNEGSPINQT